MSWIHGQSVVFTLLAMYPARWQKGGKEVPRSWRGLVSGDGKVEGSRGLGGAETETYSVLKREEQRLASHVSVRQNLM